MQKKFIRRALLVIALVGLAALGWFFLPSGTLPSISFPADSQAVPGKRPTAVSGRDRFRLWTEKYQRAESAQAKASLTKEGIQTATQRRAEMRKLIQTNPELALQSAINPLEQASLPNEVQALLEKPISGKGDLAVMGALAPVGRREDRPIRREVILGAETYHAFVYGRRLSQTTSYGTSLHGIVIDDLMAVHDQPFRYLNADEAASVARAQLRERVSPEHQPGQSLRQRPVVEVAGDTFLYCCRLHAALAEDQVRSAEAAEGPAMSYSALDDGTMALEPPVSQVNATWTLGEKQILVIRIDFSDVPGDPVSQQACATLINPTSDTFYRDTSYGKTFLTGTVAAPVYRMPKTAEYYAVNDKASELHQAAQAAASTTYSMEAFDRIMVCFASIGPGRIPQSKFGFAGLAQIEGKAIWMNGAFDHRVSCHEIGHTFGLFHANFWEADNNQVDGPGKSTEYGDPFDSMGGAGGDNRFQFNPSSKFRLHWLSETNIQTVTANGVYRVYRFDHPQATGIQALKIERSNQSYWIAYRKLFTTNPSMENGAYIFWGRETAAPSDLLDMTPGSTSGGGDASDAGLLIGSTFENPAENISITVAGKGGTSPNEYLEVNLQVGTVPPFITKQPESQVVGEGNTATFKVEAKGTPVLTYQWQFAGSDISGATLPTLQLSNVQMSQAGQYAVIVRNSIGSVSSVPVQLGVESRPQSLWTSQIGGADNDQGTAVAVNSLGDVFAAGTFRGNARFANTNLTSAGTQDLFLSRYNADGNVAWTRTAGGPAGVVFAQALAAKGTNALYLTGSTFGPVRFGDTTVGVGGATNLFLARYDQAGSILWINQSTGGPSLSADVAVAGNGDLYVAATFSGACHFGGTNAVAVASPSNEVAVVKYSPDGTALWARSVGGPTGQDQAKAIAVDPKEGFVYVVGTFAGRGVFGNFTLNSIGGSDFFVAKFTPEGDVLWVRQGGSNTGNDVGNGVAVNDQGDVVVTGTFQGVASFGDGEVASRGKYDLFVAKYSSAGDLSWIKTGGSVSDDDTGQRVRLSPSGDIYVIGSYSGNAVMEGDSMRTSGKEDVFIGKFGPGGNLVWLRSAGGSGTDAGLDLAIAESGPAYLTGFFSQDAAFINKTLTSNGGADAFLVKISGPGLAELSISRSGNDLVVSWPSSAAGFVLESAEQLKSTWSLVPGTPVVVGTKKTMTLPASGSKQFYRLRK